MTFVVAAHWVSAFSHGAGRYLAAQRALQAVSQWGDTVRGEPAAFAAGSSRQTAHLSQEVLIGGDAAQETAALTRLDRRAATLRVAVGLLGRAVAEEVTLASEGRVVEAHRWDAGVVEVDYANLERTIDQLGAAFARNVSDARHAADRHALVIEAAAALTAAWAAAGLVWPRRRSGRSTPSEAVVGRSAAVGSDGGLVSVVTAEGVSDDDGSPGSDERCALKEDLALAVDDGEQMVLHYQPIVDIGTCEVVGAEALLRWEHPQKGLLPPDAFLSLAEETGLIVPLGRWVLRQACHQARRWQCARSGRPFTIAVNLSAHQLDSPDLVEDVRTALADAELDAGSLTLEITETALVSETGPAIETLGQLRELGTRPAIDDFGTGYSSLSYLQRFPVAMLKVDRSFTEEVHRGSRQAAIAEAVINIGHTLDLVTLAEGVEVPEQLDALRMLGCDYAQGFLFSKPVASGAMEELLDRPAVPDAPPWEPVGH